MYIPIFDRDLLYPTDTPFDPGSVHIAVLKPDSNGRLPILLSPKSNPDPIDYLDTLLAILQADVFDRARIDVKTQGIFYFKADKNEFIKLSFEDGNRIIERVSKVPQSNNGEQ